MKFKRSKTGRPLVAIVHWHDAVKEKRLEEHDHLVQLSAGVVVRHTKHSIKLAHIVPLCDGTPIDAEDVLTIPTDYIRCIQWVTVAEPPPDM